MVSTPRHGGRTPLTTATPKETTAAVPERRRRSSPSLFRVQTGSYNTPSAIPRLTDQSHALTYVAEDVSHSPPLDIPPLILIQRRGGRNREQDASMHVPLTELEEQAYENQLRHLQSELQEANDAIEALRAQFVTEVERVAEERVQAYRNDERQRRQQFQEALHKLQEENRELTSALTAQSEEQLIGRAFTEKGELPPVVQAEWSRRLREVEDYWKEHVRLVEERWEATQHSQSQGKQELLAQIRELTYAATQLEELNRHLQREKGELELELCHVRVLPAREEEEKVAPPPPPSQLEALQLELETSIREMEKRELQHAQQIGRLKDELHRERARGAQLVELYSGQIQTLHEQLQHATQGRH
ncbi:hypothetical protein, conserved [Angomonas deanei]|uniref:Uncharacterized protein n=1 Tax=Angomonas deanei TaxID=59799 RepID=A0A7G2CV08_9TRYP|nr:hypothetical protein, conserved [Angomonas deanei]